MNMSKVLLMCCALCLSANACADVAAAVRAGTLGIGVDIDFALTERLNARVGYSAYDYDDQVEDSDVMYDGEVNLSHATALLDWHAFGGGFRFSFGAVGLGTKFNLVGEPLGGIYEIGDDTFTAAQVESVTGKAEFENSIAPYVGFGWGNTVDPEDRITVVFDIGAIYGGSPTVDLTATCGRAAPVGGATCNRLQMAIAEEEAELEENASIAEWWPVLSLGIAVRF